MKHQFTLYQGKKSSSSWRLRLALALKGLPFDSIIIDTSAGDTSKQIYLELNPMGQIPCLVVDGYPLSESLACIEWLDETYPDPPLYPKLPLDRAKVRQLALLVVSGIQPLQSGGVSKFHSPDEKERLKWAQHWITRGLNSYESLVSRTMRSFSFQDTITTADLCLIPQVGNAERYGVSVAKWPRIQKIVHHFKSHPVYAKSEPPTHGS